jgi:peptidoglycan/LPS O-acetylase OafA/YrhL
MGPKRVLSLDLLRGLAAFSVAIPHFLTYRGIEVQRLERFSIIAVEIFFVLSGYVLGPQILACLREPKFKNLAIFLMRRWMRTIPPYAVALSFTAILFGRFLGHEFWLYALYIQNLFSLARLNDYFSIAWSLSIEEWFYLTFPLFLVIISAFAKTMGDRNLYRACACYIAFFTILRLAHGTGQDWGRDVRRIVVFRVDSIAYGFLLFLMHKNQVAGKLRHPILIRLAGWLTVTALLAWSLGTTSALAEALFPFLAAVFGMLTISLFAALDPLLSRTAFFRGLSAHLGRISYSIYLFHLVLLLALQALPVRLALGEEFLIFMTLLVVFTTGFYFFVEQPILAARPRFVPGAQKKLSDPNLALG